MNQNENLVHQLAEELQNKGLKIISAKCTGFSEPEKLQGAEPDIIGWDSNKQLIHVGLVADSKILSSKPFQEKLDVLRQLSMASGASKGTHVPFYLGMTKEAGKSKNAELSEKLSSQDKILTIGS
jgi:hypothetical protein